MRTTSVKLETGTRNSNVCYCTIVWKGNGGDKFQASKSVLLHNVKSNAALGTPISLITSNIAQIATLGSRRRETEAANNVDCLASAVAGRLNAIVSSASAIKVSEAALGVPY